MHAMVCPVPFTSSVPVTADGVSIRASALYQRRGDSMGRIVATG